MLKGSDVTVLDGGVGRACVSNSGGIGLDAQTYTMACVECVEHLVLLLACLYCTFSTAERSAMSHLVMTLMCGSSSCIMQLRLSMQPDMNLLGSRTKSASSR